MPTFDLRQDARKNAQFAELEKTILGKKSFALFVYADWCGHCQVTKPEWEKAYNELKDRATFVNINSDVYEDLAKNKPTHLLSRIMSKQVKGYPTILYIAQKPNEVSVTEYAQSDRSHKALADYVKSFLTVKKATPSSSTKPKGTTLKKKPSPKPTTSRKPASKPTKATKPIKTTKPKTKKTATTKAKQPTTKKRATQKK